LIIYLFEGEYINDLLLLLFVFKLFY